MLFEIVNPSDQCTLVAESLELAAVCVCFLGEGRYSLKWLDCESEVPLFLFGGSDEWFKKNFNSTTEESFENAFTNQLTELIKIFESVLLGGKDQRELFELKQKGMNEAEKAAFRIQWNDERRTSMNNICGRALEIAEGMKAKMQKEALQ